MQVVLDSDHSTSAALTQARVLALELVPSEAEAKGLEMALALAPGQAQVPGLLEELAQVLGLLEEQAQVQLGAKGLARLAA
jgi:hypothetical protein